MARIIALLRGHILLVVAATLALIFTLLTALVLRADLQPTPWDLSITHEVQEFPAVPVGDVLVAVSLPGFWPWNLFMSSLIILFMVGMRWFMQAIFTVIASAGGILAEVVKNLVDRPRPTPDLAHIYAPLGTYSFPSGHVTGYTVLFGFIFYLAYTQLPRHSLAQRGVMVVCGLMIVLVGPSRVYMGQHWASDALGGYALGFSYLLLVIAAYQAYLARPKVSSEAGL